MAECSMLTAQNDMEHTSDTSVWFRSGWNYTLRAEPTLSESEPELRQGLHGGGLSPGPATQPSRETVRARGGFLAGNQAHSPFVFPDTCGHLLVGSFIHSFIQSAR